MQISNEIKLNYDDVLIKPKRSKTPSRKLVNLERAFKTLNSEKEITGIPIIAANMDTVGQFEIAKILAKYQIFTCLHKFYSKEQLIDFFEQDKAADYCFYTLGITDNDINKLKEVSKKTKNINKVCIDIANAYTEYFQDKLKIIKEILPDAIILAGNVATPEMVQELLISGSADIIKIGIGPGSSCATRTVTGVGYPQLSAVIECAEAAHGLGGLICADGGCKVPGDICKAFGGGADFVMLGGMFAGHSECQGDWKYGSDGEKLSMKFYGMSSKEAMELYNGGIGEYRASEGECKEISNKGPIENTLQQILGGLRSACTYVGASKIKDFSKCVTFIRCNYQK